MTAPSLLHAARTAPDRRARIRLMADVMREHAHGPDAACTFHHLMAAGFTAAEVEVYRDEARAILSNRPRVVLAPPPGRIDGIRLVRTARKIRKRLDAQRQTAGGRA